MCVQRYPVDNGEFSQFWESIINIRSTKASGAGGPAGVS